MLPRDRGKVRRIYPEAKTALINWIEQNFHEIDEYVAVFTMKDGTMMTIYDVYSYIGAVGLAEMAKESIHEAVRDGSFVPKEK
ncbi:hypothetical protein BSNK01_12050 [Bacillaceae bacterium]